jgi:hypothetical protein
MSNVQVQVHPRLHLDQVIEVREVREVREVGGVVVANTLIVETGRCVAVVEAALVVVVEESGCWCEKMHLSSGMAAVAEEVDGFIRVALVDSANLASHLCLSHM